MTDDARLLALMDRVEIRELMDRYCHFADFLDWTLMPHIFTADVMMDYSDLEAAYAADPSLPALDGPLVFSGYDQVRQFYKRTVSHHYGLLHFIGPQVIEVDGDTARSVSYMHENGALHDYRYSGLYRCTHLRTPEGWRIWKYQWVEHSGARPSSRT